MVMWIMVKDVGEVLGDLIWVYLLIMEEYV